MPSQAPFWRLYYRQPAAGGPRFLEFEENGPKTPPPEAPAPHPPLTARTLRSRGSSAGSIRSLRSSSSRGSNISNSSLLSQRSGLSLQQARHFERSHAIHRKRIKEVKSSLKITEPFRPSAWGTDAKRKAARRRERDKLGKENARYQARRDQISRRPPPRGRVPQRPPGRKPRKRSAPGAMFAGASYRDDVSVRKQNYTVRTLPALGATKTPLPPLSGPRIYRGRHPALRKKPRNADTAAALMARAAAATGGA